MAHAAGVSTTGIYSHFGGKHQLVEALFVEGFRSLDQFVQPALGTGDVIGWGTHYRSWALANRTLYFVMFGPAVPDFRPTAAALQHPYRTLSALVNTLSGLPLTNPDTAADHLYAVIHGYIMLELADMAMPSGLSSDVAFEKGFATACRSIGLPLISKP